MKLINLQNTRKGWELIVGFSTLALVGAAMLGGIILDNGISTAEATVLSASLCSMQMLGVCLAYKFARAADKQQHDVFLLLLGANLVVFVPIMALGFRMIAVGHTDPLQNAAALGLLGYMGVGLGLVPYLLSLPAAMLARVIAR